jgi:formylmethanofuran dehydrogenase subunit A
MAMRDWSGDATKIFKGKTVEKIRYTTEEEREALDWHLGTPVIIFTDGSWILASSDDEGNYGGAFFTSSREMSVIPQGGG